MRIISGKWRSRKLRQPQTTHTRPMTDRVREAVFDMLASRFELPGTLPPCCVADLFAGSGSMGLEALSRGAMSCDFYERGRQASRTLRENVASLEAGSVSRMKSNDAWTVCLTTPKPTTAYGLIFVDPPYRDARDTSPGGKVCRLLSDLHRAAWVDGDTIVVLHHEAKVSYNTQQLPAWEILDTRTYGTTAITMLATREDSP
jgi:16S rRNA (guanine966-N2)-methyltransferase